MDYRNGTYTAFYVSEPFHTYNLGAHAAKDFAYYHLVTAWKATDPSFPFIDSHAKTYNVRDGSSWEGTLKPRLHTRLRKSKNILLFLSSRTRPSKALTEEMEYGVGYLHLPVIVVYPELDEVADQHGYFYDSVTNLWNRLPAFKENMGLVPTVHLPMDKSMIREALSSPSFRVQTATSPRKYLL